MLQFLICYLAVCYEKLLGVFLTHEACESRLAVGCQCLCLLTETRGAEELPPPPLDDFVDLLRFSALAVTVRWLVRAADFDEPAVAALFFAFLPLDALASAARESRRAISAESTGVLHMCDSKSVISFSMRVCSFFSNESVAQYCWRERFCILVVM